MPGIYIHNVHCSCSLRERESCKQKLYKINKVDLIDFGSRAVCSYVREVQSPSAFIDIFEITRSKNLFRVASAITIEAQKSRKILHTAAVMAEAGLES